MNVGIIGVALDLGADRRGVDMGASAIRYAGLEAVLSEAGHTVRDFGNIPAPVPESAENAPSDLKYLRPILRVCDDLAERVAGIACEGWFPLILGGDHSVSLGSVGGAVRKRKLGIIWLDAHGDFNTSRTSPSGNIHGMVLSAICGYGDVRLVDATGAGAKVDPGNAVIVGARRLDAGERDLLHEAGVRVFTMHDVDRLGLSAVVESALETIDPELDGIHLSLDLDVVDPLQAPGVGTPVLGGLSYRETHLALELIAESGRLTSTDVVEVNPVLDTHNETARLAVAFVASALGQKIF